MLGHIAFELVMRGVAKLLELLGSGLASVDLWFERRFGFP
jgi:hypothetical protein